MSKTITNAKNNQRAAMLRLYEQTATRVYNTAFALLLSEADAKTAVQRSYKAMWSGLAASSVETEADFAVYAVTATVNQCKALMLAKNPKAFRLPADRRFVLSPLPTALPTVNAPAAYGVLAALPELYRLIFVCHTAVADLDEDTTATLAKLDRRTLAVAIEAEKISVGDLLKVAADVDAADVDELAAACRSLAVPAILADTVTADIAALAAPGEKARRKKTFLTLGIVVGACVLISGLCALVLWDMTRPESAETTASDDTTTPTTTADDTAPEALNLTYSTDYTATHTAEIGIRDYGVIKLELDANLAPQTVDNFLRLSEQGFYDGLTLHRVMEGFMMQGGCPYGNGTGGADKDLIGEFAENGVANTLSHTRGAISMARSGDPNSASSQFFIVHEDSTFLDGKYAAFGYVTEGIEVVDEICTTVSPKATDGNGGGIPVADQPVIDYVIVSEI